MQLFLKKALLLILVLTGLLLLILLPMKPEWVEGRKKLYIERQTAKPIDLLVLGSSRAEHTINPLLFDSTKYNVFNMGEDGHGLPSSYLMLKVLLTKYHLDIKQVLLQVDEYSMNGSVHLSRKFRDDFFVSDVDDQEVYGAFKKYCGGSLAFTIREFPFLSDLIYSDFGKLCKKFTFVFKNYLPPVKRKYEANINAYSKTKGYTPVDAAHPIAIKDEQFVMEDDDKIYFEKILALCKERNIKITLFRSPILSCQSAHSVPFDQYIDSISRNTGIKFFDFKCSYQDQAFFHDQTHPAKELADKITMNLIDSLNMR